jgi:hypothetical protein
MIPNDCPPCVHCGMCCKIAPCRFGEVTSESDHSCRFLVRKPGKGHPRYDCGIYDRIIASGEWLMSPAFGEGCVSTMCNTDRQRILEEERQ